MPFLRCSCSTRMAPCLANVSSTELLNSYRVTLQRILLMIVFFVARLIGRPAKSFKCAGY